MGSSVKWVFERSCVSLVEVYDLGCLCTAPASPRDGVNPRIAPLHGRTYAGLGLNGRVGLKLAVLHRETRQARKITASLSYFARGVVLSSLGGTRGLCEASGSVEALNL